MRRSCATRSAAPRFAGLDEVDYGVGCLGQRVGTVIAVLEEPTRPGWRMRAWWPVSMSTLFDGVARAVFDGLPTSASRAL